MRTLFLLLVLTLFSQFIIAQTKNEEYFKENFNKAMDLMEDEKYQGAIVIFKNLRQMDSTNSYLNYELGFCCLKTLNDKPKSIDYFRSAIENKNQKSKTPNDVYYYLIQSYQQTYKFTEALETYQKYQAIIENDKKLNKKTLALIEVCKNGQEIYKNKVNIEVHNLGKNINTPFDEHSPVIAADESMIIFTSKRQGGMDTLVSEKGQFTEDIYVSYNINGEWTEAKNMGKNINTKEQEATIGLSVDGQQLFIYKADDKRGGNVYKSLLNGDIWTKPELLLPDTISRKRSRETHACLAADGNSIYFTSDRSGGFGGLDIYIIRKLPNGKWAKPQNLGSTINTPLDEDGAFIHPDGVTLYFSSQGHKTMGGFDIFSSEWNDETQVWSEPQNAGYPINTTGDDIFFVLTPDGKRAYYASRQKDGFGGSDIYMIDLTDAAEKNITVVTGIIGDCNGKIPNIVINVSDASSDDVLGIYHPNIKTGKYLFLIPRNRSYKIEYTLKDSIVGHRILNLTNLSPRKILLDTLKMNCPPPVKDTRILYNGEYYDKLINVKNILFPSGESDVSPNDDLDKIAEYLKNNPDAIMEVCAYADASGSASGNLKITKKRAKAVRNYLIDKGAGKKQLESLGYGAENPVAINKNANGTWNSDGQSFNRRIEFRLIKQGKEKLLILPLDKIPDNLKNPSYNPNYRN